jgi:hypothetical protein
MLRAVAKDVNDETVDIASLIGRMKVIAQQLVRLGYEERVIAVLMS